MVVAVVSGLVGLAWPAIAWAVTGVPRAYTDTELAWRSSYIGWKDLVPFAPWVQGFGWWFRQPAGTVLLVVVLVGFAAFVAMPAARRIGLELRLWSVAYLVYLLAVFFPQSSTWRILLPIAPLLGIVALPRSRAVPGGRRGAVRRVAVGVAVLLLVGRRLRLDPAVIAGRRALTRRRAARGACTASVVGPPRRGSRHHRVDGGDERHREEGPDDAGDRRSRGHAERRRRAGAP